MQKTINYNLNKPNYSDQYDLRHWNDNMDIIDSQMKAEENARIQNDALKENLSNKVISFQSTPNDTNYPSEKLVKDNLDLKENLSNKVSSFQSTPDDTHYPSEKLVKYYVDGEIDDLKEDLSEGNMTVYAASHDDDDNFIRDYYEHKDRKKSSWSTTPNDTNYPSEKLVKDSLDGKSNTGHGHAISDVSGLQGILDAFPIKAISYYYGFISNSLQLSAMSIGELKFVNIGMSSVAGIGIQLPSDGTYLVFTCVYSALNQVYMSNTRKYYNSPTDSGTSITGTVPGGKYIAQGSSSNERNITGFILRIS